ncbi:hypothetical protein HYALB_00004513 [Hymenoscyphus albidus]|uniref:Uncharacterized protein n=1 Tax=Hymenoscyphus albidus TaxID=595503 RepID=A0A9N9LW89_9HELO|nr:hypothetical protein HYALB_00004513 [Hymenoscyphus albidus]
MLGEFSLEERNEQIPSSRDPGEDYNPKGSIKEHEYNEVEFPQVFVTYAPTVIEKGLSDPAITNQLFPVTALSELDKESFIRAWFSFFDKICFFEGLKKVRYDILYRPRQNMEKAEPYCTQQEIYINTDNQLNEREIAIHRNWDNWAVSALLHDRKSIFSSAFLVYISSIKLHADILRMLHAFIMHYGAPGFLSAHRGGTGQFGHGKPFLNSLRVLSDELREAVKKRALDDQFRVEAELGREALLSTVVEHWRPISEDDKREVLSWGVSEEVADKLLKDWSNRESVPDDLRELLEDYSSASSSTTRSVPNEG